MKSEKTVEMERLGQEIVKVLFRTQSQDEAIHLLCSVLVAFARHGGTPLEDVVSLLRTHKEMFRAQAPN